MGRKGNKRKKVRTGYGHEEEKEFMRQAILALISLKIERAQLGDHKNTQRIQEMIDYFSWKIGELDRRVSYE